RSELSVNSCSRRALLYPNKESTPGRVASRIEEALRRVRNPHVLAEINASREHPDDRHRHTVDDDMRIADLTSVAEAVAPYPRRYDCGAAFTGFIHPRPSPKLRTQAGDLEEVRSKTANAVVTGKAVDAEFLSGIVAQLGDPFDERKFSKDSDQV